MNVQTSASNATNIDSRSVVKEAQEEKMPENRVIPYDPHIHSSLSFQELLHPVQLQMKLQEASDMFYLEIVLPEKNFPRKDVSITCLNDVLTLSCESELCDEPLLVNKEPSPQYEYKPKVGTHFVTRSIRLPSNVNQSKITATLKGDILRINLPKSGFDPREVRQIPVLDEEDTEGNLG